MQPLQPTADPTVPVLKSNLSLIVSGNGEDPDEPVLEFSVGESTHDERRSQSDKQTNMTDCHRTYRHWLKEDTSLLVSDIISFYI